MTFRSLFRFTIAVFLAWALAFPPGLAAQGAAHAGQVAVAIPKVHLQRGSQQLNAAAGVPVLWQDVVNTERLGRARITLDDGSILNVSSQSSLRIVKHDAGTQQTQMDLAYGRIRARAVQLTKPGASFEVRTPGGTAGVVGTDFIVFFGNNIFQLITLEGVVHFCNLAGACVDVGAGMMSTIRGNQSPDPPAQTPNSLLMEAVNSTEVVSTQQGTGKVPGHHSFWTYVAVATLIAVPAIVIPTLSTSSPGHFTLPPPPPPRPVTGGVTTRAPH